MSLYLQYRPKTIADIVGQEHIVQILQNAQVQNKLAHAYLFTGSRGTGKTSTARIVAKMLMTRGIEDPIIVEQIIRGIEDGNLVDLIEIDGASNRNIDDIRELKEKIQFTPVVAAAKVYIIDEVHMFTKEAFNALLKTLEEPPSYAYFILATTELHKIPATIQSRCQVFPFKPIPTEAIIARLQYIASAENITIEQEAVAEIARHSTGGLRDAISLLDQLQSLPTITLQDVTMRLGASGASEAAELFAALMQASSAHVVQCIAHIEQGTVPIETCIRSLLSLVRTHIYTGIEANTDVTYLVQLQKSLLDCLQAVRHSPAPILTCETHLLSSIERATPAQAPAAPVQKTPVPDTKKPVTPPVPEPVASTSNVPSTPVSPVPTTPVTAAAPAEDVVKKATPVNKADTTSAVTGASIALLDIKQVWLEVIAKVDTSSVRMSLKDASLASYEHGVLVLQFSSSFHKDKIADPKAAMQIEKTLQELLHTPITIRAVVHTAPVKQSEDAINIADAAADVF